MSELPSVSDSLDKAFEQVGYESATDETAQDFASALSEKLSPIREIKSSETDPRHKAESENDKAKSDLIEEAYTAAENVTALESDWNESGPLIDEVSDIFGGMTPEQLFDRLIMIDRGLTSDLDGTTEMLLREYAGRAPDLPRAKTDKPTDSFDKALAEAERRSQWRPVIAKLREHGIDFRKALQVGVHWEKELRTDVVGAVAKMRAMMGAPVTEMQAQEQTQQRYSAEQEAALNSELAPMFDGGQMPLMNDATVQTRVAEIIENANLNGSPQEVLWAAYHLAAHELAQSKVDEHRERTARKASLSIGEGGTPAEAGAPSAAKSTGQALDRAFASVGV